jgi:NADPH-dependent ferric siderophore reductase
VIAGDEAALPAIAAALAALPPGARADVVVEVEDRTEEQPLPSPGDVRPTWLHRDAPGHDPERSLADALRALPWPEGRVQVFVHGELGAMRSLRRWFADERGVPPELLSVSGYWRRGKDEDGFQAEKAEESRRAREAAGAATTAAATAASSAPR